MVPLDMEFQWMNVKQKPFSHNLTYPEDIQAYSGIFRTLCYRNIFKNCRISRTLTYSEPEAYSEPQHVQNLVYSEPRYIPNAGIFKI